MKFHKRFLLLTFGLAFGDFTLVDFGNPGVVEKLESKDVVLQAVKNGDGPALEMDTGTEYTWPSVYLRNPAGWDLSAFQELRIPVKNKKAKAVYFLARVDSQPKSGEAKRLSRIFKVLVEGERSAVLRIPLVSINAAGNLKGDEFFGMRGMPFMGANGMHCERILEVVVYVDKPAERQRLEVGSPVATGAAQVTVIPANPFPFIDTFGQFMHKTWPGKVKDLADLKSRYDVETKDLAANPRPKSWNTWGGWADGPTLKATGYFRTEKVNGKWWLVDPEGKLFFSHGIDCVRRGDYTPVDDRAKWFQDLPDPKGPLGSAWGKSRSSMADYYYGGREVQTFSFLRANVIRKYPGDSLAAFTERSLARLPSWGLNTIANWSEPDIFLRRKVPYTANIGIGSPSIEGSTGYWGKFKDMFHPEFKANLVKVLSNHPTLNDPWCLGYFVDNELSWGDDTTLSLGALASPGTQPAKIAFIEDLRKKYGTIEKINGVWGGSFASWEAMLADPVKPDKVKARTDLTNFTLKMARVYFSTIRDAIKKASPQTLYLGCRFAWGNDLAVKASAEFCDVVSFNIYANTPGEKAALMAPAGDVPKIIGEFHFGAMDRGQFHTGLVPVRDQPERAAAYEAYVTDALKNPSLVGTHWFQYMDSPTTGRSLDGENYQIGFVDNCDTPYVETVAAARKIGASMYGLRSGK